MYLHQLSYQTGAPHCINITKSLNTRQRLGRMFHGQNSSRPSNLCRMTCELKTKPRTTPPFLKQPEIQTWIAVKMIIPEFPVGFAHILGICTSSLNRLFSAPRKPSEKHGISSGQVSDNLGCTMLQVVLPRYRWSIIPLTIDIIHIYPYLYICICIIYVYRISITIYIYIYIVYILKTI